MRIKNVFTNIIGWGMLNVLAFAIAIMRMINNKPYHISLTIAVLMFIVFVYVLILRRIDGPSFIDSLNDERLWDISVNAKSISFWFLFISVWCLSAALEFFNSSILKENVSLFLAAIGTLGLFIYMSCFVWQKYKVED